MSSANARKYPCVISANHLQEKLLKTKKGHEFPALATPLGCRRMSLLLDKTRQKRPRNRKTIVFGFSAQIGVFRSIAAAYQALPPNNFSWRVPHCFRPL